MQGEEEARPAGAAGPSAARVSRGGGVRAEPATVAGRGCGGGGTKGRGLHRQGRREGPLHRREKGETMKPYV
jgi:hypothetical protein